MSNRLVPFGSGYIAVSLERAHGKAIRALDINQTGDTFNVNPRFDEDIAVELRFVIAVKASATLLQYEQGDARVVKWLDLESHK